MKRAVRSYTSEASTQQRATRDLPIDLSLLPRQERVLVACSGGADSVALLLVLHKAEYSVAVAHVNHGTRGEESDADERFVRQLCQQLDLPCAFWHLPLKSASEAALREARYEALIQMAREYSCPRIATGHTASDVLETILLNWLRGATITGFAGITPQRQLEEGVLLVRPMLAFTRETVREYLQVHGYTWREDSSNQSSDYRRNRIRNELLPLLADLTGDESTQRLALQTTRTASLWRDDLELLDLTAQAALRDITIESSDELWILDGRKFSGLAVALQRRVLRRAAQTVSQAARDLEAERVEEVRTHVIANGRRAVWQWRRDLRVEWTGEYSGNRLRFTRV